jgi:WD40 repeat protein
MPALRDGPAASAQVTAIPAPVVDACFGSDGAMLAVASGDGVVRLFSTDGGMFVPLAVAAAHDGAILHLHPEGRGGGFLTGGDDGRVVRIRSPGAFRELAVFPGRWVDGLAVSSANGLVAAGIGRSVHVVDAEGRTVAEFHGHPSTVADLAFSPDGGTIAVAHYQGVSLWSVGAGMARRLEWRGSHVRVLWSPDGRYVVTATQDNEVHAWRLADAAGIQLAGYGGKARSLSWGPRGSYLATSGADGAMLWTFRGEGPASRPPIALGPERRCLVSAVACHPNRDVVAFGYKDGAVLQAGLGDGPVQEVRPPSGSPVQALCWSPDGRWLIAGTEDGCLERWRQPAQDAPLVRLLGRLLGRAC